MSELITEELDLSWENCEDIEALQELEDELQLSYGLSYEEYVNLRNSLVRQYNHALPMEVLEQAIINTITIDLVGRGLIEIDSMANDTPLFKVSKKGEDALLRAYTEGKIKPVKNSPFYALMFLRNAKLLKEENEISKGTEQ